LKNHERLERAIVHKDLSTRKRGRAEIYHRTEQTKKAAEVRPRKRGEKTLHIIEGRGLLGKRKRRRKRQEDHPRTQRMWCYSQVRNKKTQGELLEKVKGATTTKRPPPKK